MSIPLSTKSITTICLLSSFVIEVLYSKPTNHLSIISLTIISTFLFRDSLDLTEKSYGSTNSYVLLSTSYILNVSLVSLSTLGFDITLSLSLPFSSLIFFPVHPAITINDKTISSEHFNNFFIVNLHLYFQQLIIVLTYGNENIQHKRKCPKALS
ncbi:hypothetical protein D3C76_638130 [compost metagenome]